MQPNQALIDAGLPTITLAGVAWPVPPFTIRILRNLDPVLLRLAPVMAGETRAHAAARLLLQDGLGRAPSEGEIVAMDVALREALAARGLATPMEPTRFISDLTDENRDDMITMALLALKQGHPDIKADDVLEMEITFAELIGAYATIRQQASAERKGPRQPGEASGALAAP